MNYRSLWVSLLTVGLIVSCHKADDPTPSLVSPDVEARVGGALLTPDEVFNGIAAPEPTPIGLADAVLPQSYFLKMPPVDPKGQGAQASCAGWSVAYATTYLTNANAANADGTPNYSRLLSPAYIYSQVKLSSQTCDGGSYLISNGTNKGALDIAIEQGICPWQTMPYQQNTCQTKPTAQQTNAASANRVQQYTRLSASTPTDIKKALSTNQPVIVCVEMDNDLVNAGTQFVWQQHGASLGNHFVVVCGYDDTKKAFQFINSWGTNWGNKGYGWISYDLFPRVVLQAVALQAVTQTTGAPTAAFQPSAIQGDTPLTVTFTNKSGGTITSYAWNFGDGSTTTTANPTHMFTKAGNYTVQLTVSGPGGTATAQTTIRAGAVQTAGVSGQIAGRVVWANVPARLHQYLLTMRDNGRGANIRLVDIDPNDGFVIVDGTNGYYGEGIPQGVITGLSTVNTSRQTIKDVAITTSAGIVLTGQNTYYATGLSDPARQKLTQYVGEGRTLNAFALGGDSRWWSNLYDSGGWYAYHTQSYFDDMTAFGAVYETELTLDNAGWVLFDKTGKRASWRNIPTGCADMLKQLMQTNNRQILNVAFSASGGYVIVYQ